MTFDFLVVSDLHMHHDDPDSPKSPSFLTTKSEFASPLRNPISGIQELLRREGLKPAWLLTPGDLGDQCNDLAQSQAWQALETLRRKIGAKRLIATVGNHDVDSRRQDEGRAPNSSLQHLAPTFPVSSQTLADRYWRASYINVVDREADVNLLSVNSCSFHGIARARKSGVDEHVRGRLSGETLLALAETIKRTLRARNVLLVHHHVRRHPWLADNSQMVGGEELTELLRETGKQWLVVHGHRHVPFLSYADGGATSPIVLSAGSVAAKPYPIRGRHPRNQIHFVRLSLGSSRGVGLKGTVTSWDWFPFVGWQKANKDSGLPYKCGFGFRGPIDELAIRVADFVKRSRLRQRNWSEVEAEFEDLRASIPQDLDTFETELAKLGAVVGFDRLGVPILISWRGT